IAPSLTFDPTHKRYPIDEGDGTLVCGRDPRYFFGGGFCPRAPDPPIGGPGGPAVSGILILSVLLTPDRTSTLMPSERPSWTSFLTKFCFDVSTSTYGFSLSYWTSASRMAS